MTCLLIGTIIFEKFDVKYGAELVTVIFKGNETFVSESASSIEVMYTPTSEKAVGDIIIIVVPINAAVTPGVVGLVKVRVGVVKSGSANAGIATLRIEFSDTVTAAKVVVPSLKDGGLFGTAIFIAYVLLAPPLLVSVILT